MGPVYLFVLVATATMDPASGRTSWQTVGYYETAAGCQTALLQAEKQNRERDHVRLTCRPIRAVP
jgi:hypothetical protein